MIPSSSVTRRVKHIFTVDVEEYFQVNTFERYVSRGDWETLPSRVEGNVEDILEILRKFEVAATFFVLGWVARRLPGVVRRIADEGHEVASHGWWHRKIPTLSREEFREEARRSREELERLSGQRVSGFRAPSFSLVPGVEWAFDVLLEEGYEYDSSVFPFRRPGYGYPGAPTVPHTVIRANGRLLELPLATSRWAGFRLPGAGGAYFRQLPYALTRRALDEHGDNGVPAVFYIHPWELDPGQPRLPVSPVRRARHYGGLRRTKERLCRLLSEYRFTSISSSFREDGAGDARSGLPAVSYSYGGIQKVRKEDRRIRLTS